MKIAILRNEDPESSMKWQKACENLNISHTVINLTASDWLKEIQSIDFDLFLLKPPGRLSHFKALYDERLYIISKILKLNTYPTFEECIIYENKRVLSYFLEANGIPHPSTKVFYNKEEAIAFAGKAKYPLVAKTSIGGSGSGVEIIKTAQNAKKYVVKAFSKQGIKRRFGPNRVTGSPKYWLSKTLKSPSYFIKRINEYLSIYKHGERDYVIFQEYIPHDYEWRCVRIGDSYFAHRKRKLGDKASGTKGIDYVNPPESLLDFTRDLCIKHNFNCMAADIFEDGRGGYLINELQTIFGHVQAYILSVDGNPGRFRFDKNGWLFEKGDFNTNESYDLRLKTAIDLYGF